MPIEYQFSKVTPGDLVIKAQDIANAVEAGYPAGDTARLTVSVTHDAKLRTLVRVEIHDTLSGKREALDFDPGDKPAHVKQRAKEAFGRLAR